MAVTRTAVGIVGAGPSGLLLGHLLHQAGIDSVAVDIRSEAHAIERVRAGVLEQGTVDLLRDAGVGARLAREGMRHEGLSIALNGRRHRIDLAELTGGRAITVYGQNEIVRDLIGARRAADAALHFDAEEVRIHGLDEDRATLEFRAGGTAHVVTCDYIAGCDGFHGVSRTTAPAGALRTYDTTYPFAWLGILAQAPPSSHELVYSRHARGFALFSMRSPEITRLYLQVAPDENLDDWPDERIWSELRARLQTDDGWAPTEGPILHKNLTGMRSFMIEPMRYRRLFLAGDAAHIVPPTGAKGLNLAVADVARLARALAHRYRSGSESALDDYSARSLRRAWRAQRFSSWMTWLVHVAEGHNDFDLRRQEADLEYLVTSRAAMAGFAEEYTGAPMD
jgi:p-hydroxybenzoate 3-monooxygenase